MGPGTHVINRLQKRMAPLSHTDSVAMYHDIDYLSKQEPILSDVKAILRTDNSLQGWAMRFGLGARSALDALLHILPIPNFTHINGRNDTLNMNDDQLRQYLLNIADQIAIK